MLKVQTLRTVINFSSAKIDVLITLFLAYINCFTAIKGIKTSKRPEAVAV